MVVSDVVHRLERLLPGGQWRARRNAFEALCADRSRALQRAEAARLPGLDEGRSGEVIDLVARAAGQASRR